ncbi:GLPGLI family protein [Winogradskyella ursingii]|uniref:GLPGLI family protein n=1 Tax=Winogradskyella ursingii TaxID=2686079 RepID=UPI0015C84002|nr:GLPGLI family protein [Winogradskyella ursingii]
MATVIRTLTIFLVLAVSKGFAQDFQGVATYRTQRSINIKMDSTKVNSDMQAQILAQMKKQFQKTFKLTFNKSESIYKEEESLDTPQVGGGNFQMVMVGSGGGNDVLYKNTKDQTFTNQQDAMGKIFLIKDDIEKIDWKLEADTKYIGEYQCYKATYTKQVEVFNDSGFSSSNDKKEVDKEPEMQDHIITAWYAPQIPINNGPAKYQGLPGLILEVHDGKLTIMCSQIVLNPEEKVKIEAPTKGKEVNQQKFDEIMDKKAKEMMERYAPKNGRKGESIEIRIGG